MPHSTRAKYEQTPAADDTTMFIFGAGGDLVKRLLIPSLYNLDRDRLIAPEMRIVGIDLAEHDDESFRRHLKDFIADKAADNHSESREGSLDESHWRISRSGCTIDRAISPMTPSTARSRRSSPPRTATTRSSTAPPHRASSAISPDSSARRIARGA